MWLFFILIRANIQSHANRSNLKVDQLGTNRLSSKVKNPNNLFTPYGSNQTYLQQQSHDLMTNPVSITTSSNSVCLDSVGVFPLTSSSGTILTTLPSSEHSIDPRDDQSANEDQEADEEEEPLNSEDDVSDEEPEVLFESDNVVVCQYDKVSKFF